MVKVGYNMWDAFRAYLLTDKKLSSKKHNVETQKFRFEKIILWFKDKDFTRENFNLFIDELREKGYQPSYINNFIKTAKHLDKFLKINQLQDYTYYKEPKNNYEVLSMQEIKKIAECHMKYRSQEYTSIRNKSLIYLLGTTGMRIGEALTLEWRDITESPWGVVAHIRPENAKNGEERFVPIPQKTAILITSVPRITDLVFNTKDDKHISEDLQARCQKVGITKRVWWHLFRHSYITHMLVDKGWDSQLLMKITGHKDPKSMFRYNQQDLRNMFIVQESQELEEETQTFEQVSDSIRKYIEKTVSKKRFKKVIEELDGCLVIKLEKVYK